MDIDAQEVINDLAAKIGGLEAQNAILRAQIREHQKKQESKGKEGEK